MDEVDISVELPLDSPPEEPKPATDDGGDKGKPAQTKEKPSDEVKLSKKDYDSLQKRLEELQSSERYWADQAKKSGAAPSKREEPKPVEEPDEAPDKFADDLAAQGLKALQKRGIPTTKDVIGLIREEATKIAADMIAKSQSGMSRDAQVLQEFPDLANPKSELSVRTIQTLKAMKDDDPDFVATPSALKLAAKAAKAELASEGRSSKEEERQDRIRRQAGDRGRRQADYEEISDDSSLTADQLKVATAFGLKAEDYIESRKGTKR